MLEMYHWVLWMTHGNTSSSRKRGATHGVARINIAVDRQRGGGGQSATRPDVTRCPLAVCSQHLVDEDINTIVTPTAPTATHTGPITRARARQLNYQVLPFLGNDSNVHENMMLRKLDMFVLFTNEGPSMDKGYDHLSRIKHGDDGMRKGNKTGVWSDDFRTLKHHISV